MLKINFNLTSYKCDVFMLPKVVVLVIIIEILVPITRCDELMVMTRGLRYEIRKNSHECRGVLKLGTESSLNRSSANSSNHKGFGFFVESHHNCGWSSGSKCKQPQNQHDPTFRLCYRHHFGPCLWLCVIFWSHKWLKVREKQREGGGNKWRKFYDSLKINEMDNYI